MIGTPRKALFCLFFSLRKAFPGVPAGNLKGQVYLKFEDGKKAIEDLPKKGKRGHSRSRDTRGLMGITKGQLDTGGHKWEAEMSPALRISLCSETKIS